VLDGGRLIVIGVFSGVFVRGAFGLVVFRDVVINEGFSVELTLIAGSFTMALAMRHAKSGMMSFS
jgi:hypothetical protein